MPLPERHRLREQDTERAYEDWQLRLSFEPVEQVQEALTQHWNTYDEYLPGRILLQHLSGRKPWTV